MLSASVFCSLSSPIRTLILHQLTEYALKVIRIEDLLILLEDRANAGDESVDEIPHGRMRQMPSLAPTTISPPMTEASESVRCQTVISALL
jgi:hypothetical protein